MKTLSDIEKEFEKQKIKNGYYLEYQGINRKLFYQLDDSTSCVDVKSNLNQIYTEGFNFGIGCSKQLFLNSLQELLKQIECMEGGNILIKGSILPKNIKEEELSKIINYGYNAHKQQVENKVKEILK